MLPPFIIEQIRQREEEERRRDNRAVLELPLPMVDAPQRSGDEDDAPRGERGVFIIDLMG
jgi:hypothetical protein